MKTSKEVDFCKKLFYTNGRNKIIELLDNSNLTEKEKLLLHSRYVEGLKIKEMCEKFHIEEEAYKKSQRRTLIKFYNFIQA
jgi:DNA-directed RNA polymerase specialized sigma subunit